MAEFTPSPQPQVVPSTPFIWLSEFSKKPIVHVPDVVGRGRFHGNSGSEMTPGRRSVLQSRRLQTVILPSSPSSSISDEPNNSPLTTESQSSPKTPVSILQSCAQFTIFANSPNISPSPAQVVPKTPKTPKRNDTSSKPTRKLTILEATQGTCVQRKVQNVIIESTNGLTSQEKDILSDII